jgi:hypothetical protein
MFTGIPWYEQAHYGALKHVFPDGAALPATYSSWLAAAEAAERRLKAAGHAVIRAHIEPDEFRSWCTQRGLRTDAHARERFAREAAHRAQVASVDPRPVVVEFADGEEDMGIMVSNDVVEVGVRGLPVEMHEGLLLDGEPHQIIGMSKTAARHDAGTEVTVRLRVAATRYARRG